MSRAAAASVLLLVLAACGRGPRNASSPASEAPSQEAAVSAEVAPSPKTSVTLYFPSASADALAGETREIVETGRASERGTQVLAALLEGPRGEGVLAAVPEGTTLRRLWVRDDGTAYADFSDELSRGLRGGSSDELLTIYAIVDSLAMNVPEIKRVGILVGGRERDTLGGHVDVRRPLRPNTSLVAAPAAKE